MTEKAFEFSSTAKKEKQQCIWPILGQLDWPRSDGQENKGPIRNRLAKTDLKLNALFDLIVKHAPQSETITDFLSTVKDSIQGFQGPALQKLISVIKQARNRSRSIEVTTQVESLKNLSSASG